MNITDGAAKVTAGAGAAVAVIVLTPLSCSLALPAAIVAGGIVAGVH